MYLMRDMPMPPPTVTAQRSSAQTATRQTTRSVRAKNKVLGQYEEVGSVTVSRSTVQAPERDSSHHGFRTWLQVLASQPLSIHLENQAWSQQNFSCAFLLTKP